LSCGAPLALHFVVGRVLHDYALEPVLSELKQASQQVAEFYRFCLEAAWQRISGVAKDVLRYMGHIAETSVTWTELSGSWNLPDSELRAALADLRQWYLVEAVPDAQGNIRYDLHPWVRHSVRGRLVDDWQLSAQDVERIAKWKMDQITKWKHSQG
jgi:hypothetical protein